MLSIAISANGRATGAKWSWEMILLDLAWKHAEQWYANASSVGSDKFDKRTMDNRAKLSITDYYR
jgi:hypothetical protein